MGFSSEEFHSQNPLTCTFNSRLLLLILKGVVGVMKDFRPISLLGSLCKLFA